MAKTDQIIVRISPSLKKRFERVVESNFYANIDNISEAVRKLIEDDVREFESVMDIIEKDTSDDEDYEKVMKESSNHYNSSITKEFLQQYKTLKLENESKLMYLNKLKSENIRERHMNQHTNINTNQGVERARQIEMEISMISNQIDVLMDRLVEIKRDFKKHVKR